HNSIFLLNRFAIARTDYVMRFALGCVGQGGVLSHTHASANRSNCSGLPVCDLVTTLNDCPYPVRGDVTDLLTYSVGPGDLDVAFLLVAQTEMDDSAAGAVYAASSEDGSVLLVVLLSGQGNLGSDRIQIRATGSDELEFDPIVSGSLIFEEL